MDYYQPHQRRQFTGRACSLHPDQLTAHAVSLAFQRAADALEQGNLITPAEAMVAALGESRESETLFSIARAIAWETGGNQDDILCKLGEKYPDFS